MASILIAMRPKHALDASGNASDGKTEDELQGGSKKSEESQDSLLLLLPGELRNRIYEMALFHEEGGGVISPTQYNDSEATGCASMGTAMVLKGGNRFVIWNGAPAVLSPAPRSLDPALEERHTKMLGAWMEQSTKQKNHLCTVNCLLQPSLTKVSVQIREECLPIFYSINKWHLEMNNFKKSKKPAASPIHWWRGIGDKNLKLIHSPNLLGSSVFEKLTRKDTGEIGVMIRYRKPASGPDIVKTRERLYQHGAHLKADIRAYLDALQADLDSRDRMLKIHLQDVAQNYLSIEDLEEMTGMIEPWMHEYLWVD